MKQQTSIDWFIDNLPERFKNAIVNTCKEEIEQAKQMGKEQISKAWDDGNYAYFYSKETSVDFDNGEQYYNETYNK